MATMHKALLWTVSILAAVTLALGEIEHYNGNSLLRVVPKNVYQLSLLQKLEDEGVDFWRGPDRENRIADLMITPENKQMVMNHLKNSDIEYQVHIDDVERLFENERQEQRSAIEKQLKYKSAYSDNEAITGFWKLYNKYDNIISLLDILESQNPDLVEKHEIGKSYLGRPINAIRIGLNSNANKPVVYIQGGIHAREWISPATVTYFAQQLVNGKKNGTAEIVSLLETYDFYIVPVLNVDGYEYTHTTSRLWRKTRRPSANSPSCYGADPNRNFGYEWGGQGASASACSETYRGDKAFSESETQAERDFILNDLKGRVKIYLAVHSYGQYWLYPWGYTSALTPDDAQLNAKAMAATAALKKPFGTKYTVGTSTNVLYAAAGGSDDWAYGTAKVPYSYTVELRDTGYYGFTLPASQIEPTGSETTLGFIALCKEVAKTLKL